MISTQIRMVGFGLCFAATMAFATLDDSTQRELLIAQAGVTGDPDATGSQNDALFVAIDANHDGFLTEQESNDEVRDFDKADINGDGRLDATEFDTSRSGSDTTEGIDPNPQHDTD